MIEMKKDEVFSNKKRSGILQTFFVARGRFELPTSGL